ncbi:MAG: ABC transporter permease [bacterium]|nr:ABC transporter permease [bacterium]
MKIFKYIGKRLLQTIPLLIIVSLISFFIIRLSPVDPLAELRLNPSISQETLDKEIKRLQLDKPIIVQYCYWAKSFVKGDLGYTSAGEKVSVKLKERIPNTLLLTLVVIFMTWSVGIPLGIAAAYKKESFFDRLLTIFASVGMAIPSFFFAILMLIFAVKTGFFPVGGLTSYNFNDMNFFHKVFDIAKHLALPSLVLFTISLSGLQRQMRANMLDVMDSEYIKFARAKGVSEWKIIFKHALRNAVNPMITLLGFEFAGLLSGAALTEYVFQYPGLGRLILEAVMKSDINLVMASLMIGTIMLIAGNLIADILLMITDPRIRR